MAEVSCFLSCEPALLGPLPQHLDFMERVLVTGADGFIGRRLCELLEQRGHSVLRVVRAAKGVSEGTAISLGDLETIDVWPAVLDGVDTVMHLAARAHVFESSNERSLEKFRATNVTGTMRLASAAASSRVKRFIFVSSIGVSGAETHGSPFTEVEKPHPTGPYAISKWEAEIELGKLAAFGNLEVVIVRPPLVYGPHAKGNLKSLLKLVATGLPLPLGALRNPRHFVGLDNLCDLLIRCIGHPAASGCLFLASEPEPRSSAELIEAFSRVMHGRARVWRCPMRLLAAGAQLIGRSTELRKLSAELQVDSSEALRLLQWRPTVPFEREICQMVNTYVNAASR